MYPKPLLTYDTSIDNCPTRTFFFTSSNSSASSEILPNYTDGGIVDLYHTAFLLVPVTGFVISLVVGSIVSLATMGHKKMKQVPSNYLSPMVYFLLSSFMAIPTSTSFQFQWQKCRISSPHSLFWIKLNEKVIRRGMDIRKFEF